MPRQLWIPEALEEYDLDVEEVPGWETRGSTAFNPVGVVGHHTAGPKTGVRPSLKVCVNGREGLPGPLCNVFLDRNGVAIVVAAGRANHAGKGGFKGLVGNSSMFGIEAEDDGDGTWTDAQLEAFPKVVAALLSITGMNEVWYCSHRTWAPTRKIDPTNIEDTWMRSQVAVINWMREHPEVASMNVNDDIVLGEGFAKILGQPDKKIKVGECLALIAVTNREILVELQKLNAKVAQEEPA